MLETDEVELVWLRHRDQCIVCFGTMTRSCVSQRFRGIRSSGSLEFADRDAYMKMKEAIGGLTFMAGPNHKACEMVTFIYVRIRGTVGR